RREITAEDVVRLGRYEIYASLVHDGGTTPFASGRTMPLRPAVSNVGAVRARSAANYGTPAHATDDHLRSHLHVTPPSTPGTDGDVSGGFGTRRRTP
ncbi:MAG: hypothetical protein WBD02_01560, partial [Acidimicrobiia bacterium]